MSNTIKITACDNQLMLFAINKVEDNCYELCNIKSGNSHTVDVTLNIEDGTFQETIEANGVSKNLNETKTVQLPAGEYYLVYAGLNWGGPYNFKFEFNDTTYELLNNPEQPLEGVIWSLGNKNISFNVLEKAVSLS
jgi:hypothetical protein